MFSLRTAIVAFAAFVGVSVNSASAVTVSCPGTVITTDREFSLSTSSASTCLATGTGNINGNGDTINNLGYVTIDKSDNTTLYVGVDGELTISGTGGLSGSFSFTPVAGYSNYVLALKSGEGQIDPDWAAFLLPAGVTSGDWAITAGSQTLSHANLYAQISAIPLPAGIWLLGTVVAGGLGFGARHRRKIIERQS